MSPADGECEEEIIIGSKIREKMSTPNQPETPTLASNAQTPSNPPTPSTAFIPRIADTPPPVTPGSVGSGSEASSTFLSDQNLGSNRDVHNSPRCSIPGGEKGWLIYFNLTNFVNAIFFVNYYFQY